MITVPTSDNRAYQGSTERLEQAIPDFPSGTFTFLFTDIEGSATLWEWNRQGMAEAVDRHLALLRTAIDADGGVLFKMAGDAVQAIFHSAPGAIATAVAAQRALQVEQWPDPPGPLYVRMALNAGETIPRDGDYLASPLNRPARLLVAGHGSQAEGMAASHGALVFTRDRPLREQALSASTGALGPEQLADARDAGRALTLEAALTGAQAIATAAM